MRKNKYDSFHFWEQLFNKFKGDVSSMFRNQTITSESVFFHGVIVNCNNVNPKDEWIYFPDIKAMIGFIKHIYLPAAFLMFLGDNDEIICPDTDCKNLLEIMDFYEGSNDKQMIPEMRILLEKINDILKLEDESVFSELILFSEKFSKLCNTRLDKFGYFDVFQSPIAVGEYIINCYKGDENVDISDIEDQLGVGAEEWLNICKDVYHNEFMNRRFTDILNNRIRDML